MKIREHRGGLAESMKTVAEIEPTLEALTNYVNSKISKYYKHTFTADEICIEKYGREIDTRIGWNTHLVSIKGYGVFGMTDGPIEPPKYP